MKAIRGDDVKGCPVLEKYCKKCGDYYPMTTEFWYRDKRAKDGFRHCCKGCYSELPSVMLRIRFLQC